METSIIEFRPAWNAGISPKHEDWQVQSGFETFDDAYFHLLPKINDDGVEEYLIQMWINEECKLEFLPAEAGRGWEISEDNFLHTKDE